MGGEDVDGWMDGWMSVVYIHTYIEIDTLFLSFILYLVFSILKRAELVVVDGFGDRFITLVIYDLQGSFSR